MFKYYSSYFLVYGGLGHLICCGLPIFIGLNTMFANLFFFQSFSMFFEIFERIEIYIFSIVSALFFLLIILEIYNKKIKNKNQDNCIKEECHITKKRIRFNIIFSSMLYIINCYFFLFEKIT